MGRIDSKVAAGTLGGAISTVIWTLLAAFVEQVQGLAPETLASLVAATGVIASFVFGYRVPNAASPLPGDGVGVAPEDRG